MPNNDAEREIIDGLLKDAEGAIVVGALAKAAAIYRGILAVDPAHVVALRQLGGLAVEFGDYPMAIAHLREAVAHDPRDPDLYHGIGTALRLMGQGDQALLAWQGALGVDPTYAPALHDSGMLLQQRGELERASEMYRRLAAAHRDHFEAVFNRAVVLFQQDNLLAAERWFHQAARLNGNDPRPLVNLAMIYRVWGFADRAIACLEHALTLKPDSVEAHWNLANVLLLSGNYERGFVEYEWRFRRPNFAERSFPLPGWRGGDLRGQTILLAAEQGLGDAIQFARFAAPLAARGAAVIVECLAGLERLIATAPGVGRIANWGTVPEDATCVLPLLSAPHLIGMTLASLPGPMPYLKVPAGVQAPALEEAGFKVGLVWRGNPRHDNDRNRSIPLNLLALLSEVPGVAWYSLQIGAGLDEVAGGPWAGRMRALTHHLKDFAITAAFIDQLDLVISVDTAVAHLAGAMGRPVWALISRGNDWRWGENRADSPWYPSMRLFRQHHPRNWVPAIAEVAEALRAAAARGHV